MRTALRQGLEKPVVAQQAFGTSAVPPGGRNLSNNSNRTGGLHNIEELRARNHELEDQVCDV